MSPCFFLPILRVVTVLFLNSLIQFFDISESWSTLIFLTRYTRDDTQITRHWILNHKISESQWTPSSPKPQLRAQNAIDGSLRASSPIWASETSLARPRERAARSREARFACPNRRACSHARLAEVFKTNPVISLFDCQASHGPADDFWACHVNPLHRGRIITTLHTRWSYFQRNLKER